MQVWQRAAYRCQLISKLLVQCFEPTGQADPRLTITVQRHDAIVNVHHVGTFHEGVSEVFVGRIERVVDLESPGRLAESSVHTDVPVQNATSQDRYADGAQKKAA